MDMGQLQHQVSWTYNQIKVSSSPERSLFGLFARLSLYTRRPRQARRRATAERDARRHAKQRQLATGFTSNEC
jgi:hypothetical protein